MKNVGDILNKLEELLNKWDTFKNRASRQQQQFYATHSISDFRRLNQPHSTHLSNQQCNQLIDRAHHYRLTLDSTLPTIEDALQQLIRQIHTNVAIDTLLTNEMLIQKEEIFSEVIHNLQETCPLSLNKANYEAEWAETWDTDFEEELSLSSLALNTISSIQTEHLNLSIDSLDWSENELEVSAASDEPSNTSSETSFREELPTFNLQQFVKVCWEVMCKAERSLKYFEEGIITVNQLNIYLAPANFTPNSTALLVPSAITPTYNLHKMTLTEEPMIGLLGDCKDKSNKRYSM